MNLILPDEQKKTGNGCPPTTTCLTFMVRPAGFPSINSGQAHLRPTDSKSEPLGFLTSSNYYKQLKLFNMIFHIFSDFFQF